VARQGSAYNQENTATPAMFPRIRLIALTVTKAFSKGDLGDLRAGKDAGDEVSLRGSMDLI
jgi:hypothetical protein